MDGRSRVSWWILGLAFFMLPIFAQASDAPTLTAYTLSYSTIYPTASAESGLATSTSISVGFSEQVKVSIKILSAAGTTVRSLYSSSSVTHPTPKVWNGTNDAGTAVGNGTYTILITATSTATGLAMTDSSKTITIAAAANGSSQDSTDSATSSSTEIDTATDDMPSPTATSVGGGPAEYLPIPTLRIITAGDRTISSGADTAFTALVYDNKGNKRDDAIVTWSFGDGMQRTGASVFHAYYEAGEYSAVVRAKTTDGGNAFLRSDITVKDAAIHIASVSSRGITLANASDRTLDLSLWRLSMGGQTFTIPADTEILAGRSVLFPAQVTELPLSDAAELLYPSGEVAATYPQAHAPQPSSGPVSYISRKTVEPIISQAAEVPHDNAVSAPAAATDLAAAGAALPEQAEAAKPANKGLFHSPWTLGFLGVLVASGGAFILL